MIKIGYVVSTLKSTGPINVIYNIVKYLDFSKFKVCIIALSSVKIGDRTEDFEKLGIEIINLNLSKVGSVFHGVDLIEEVILEKDISILHGHGLRADILISKVKNTKKLSTLHNYAYDDYRMTYGKLQGSLMAYFHLRCIKNTYVVACSKSIKNKLKERLNYDVDFIQNGVDLDIFNISLKEKKEELRQNLGLPIDKKIYISVGHLNSRKDPITIIESFKRREDAYLVFLGDGELKEESLKLIKMNENIKIVGFVTNVKDYLYASDYFISASLAEGLPNTVMEALACGLPCVLSSIDSHFEILEYDFLVGKLFEVKNIDELYCKMIEMEKENYSALSERAHNLIFKNLSAMIMSDNYQKSI